MEVNNLWNSAVFCLGTDSLCHLFIYSFINETLNEEKFNFCKLFADDSKQYGIANVLNKSSTTQSDLNTLTDWSVNR